MGPLPRYFLELTEDEARTVVEALARSRAALAGPIAQRLVQAMRDRETADENARAGAEIVDDPAPLERGES